MKELFSWFSAVLLHAVLIVCFPFLFGVWSRMWNSIVLVPDRCLFIYFTSSSTGECNTANAAETPNRILTAMVGISVNSSNIKSRSSFSTVLSVYDQGA